MAGILFLILSILTGLCVCRDVFGRLFDAMKTTFDKKEISCSNLFLILPTSFATGALLLTWPVYILAWILNKRSDALLLADVIVMTSAAVYIGLHIFADLRRGRRVRAAVAGAGMTDNSGAVGGADMADNSGTVAGADMTAVSGGTTGKCTRGMLRAELSKLSCNEIIVASTILVFSLFIMYMTCYVKDGQLTVGLSVFGDFSPHIGMIRSFSRGGNIPARYTVFAADDIKYHFMYEFFVGNLEFLGMRIDHAFNIVSALSLAGAYSMLYSLTVRLCGRKGGGALACLFMMFRSSFTLFLYAASLEEGSVISTLLNNDMFIGSTENESWGLWNINVYCNQRHLSFAMIVMFLMLHLFLPYLFEAGERLKGAIARRKQALEPEEAVSESLSVAEKDLPDEAAIVKNEIGNTAQADAKKRFTDRVLRALDNIFIPVQSFIFDSLFSKAGWRAGEYAVPIAAGIFLGLIGFWNGAVVITTLIVLFFLAAASDRRLEYLITAAVAGVLVFAQSKIFIKGSAFSVQYQYGFLAESKTFMGAIVYLIRLTGILLILIYAVFVLSTGVKRWIIAAFSMPIVFSFTVSLTPDINVNHKYIFLAIILLDMIAGGFIASLMAKKKPATVVSCLLLIVLLTATGVYDFYTFCRENRRETSISCSLDAPLTQWIMENTEPEDVFLTAPYSFSGGTGSEVVLAGVRMYMAWPYFGWSAGYDTDRRQYMVEQLYGASSQDELEWLIRSEEIDYIIIEKANRDAEEYELNEELIRSVYPEVYTEEEGEWRVSIFATASVIGE